MHEGLQMLSVIFAVLFLGQEDLPVYSLNEASLSSDVLIDRQVFGDNAWVRLLILDEIQLNTQSSLETDLWFMQERTQIIWNP